MGCFSDPSKGRSDSYEHKRWSEKAVDLTTAGSAPSEEEMQKRLKALQAVIQDAKVDWYIVPSEDEHQSEYLADSEKRRQWISRFDGSSGAAIVPASSSSDAVLFLDSRYWVQGDRQIPEKGWKVFRAGAGSGGSGKDMVVNGWVDWIIALPDGSRVGVDPKLISASQANIIRLRLSGSSSRLVPITENLVDKVWEDAPSRSLGPILSHPMKFAGETVSSKLSKLRDSVGGQTSSSWIYLVPALPSIAWMLNLRCTTDVLGCPAPFAYCALTEEDCVLFVDERKLQDGELRGLLDDAGVSIQSYGIDKVGGFIQSYVSKVRTRDEKANIAIGASRECSWALADVCAKAGSEVSIVTPCPVDIAKAIKNPAEIQGFRNSYLRDGRAMVRWMAWLEKKILKEGKDIREWDAGAMLTKFRMREEHYVPSTPGITASGPNGALPHYSPVRGQDLVIDRESTMVVDSGTQYVDGTIDNTRTLYFGKSPSDDMKRAYTRVLQCHMGVAQAVWPKGYTSDHIIMLAKQPLFKDGLDFGHGIGHGVGAFGAVHEYPVSFPHGISMDPGMVCTVEPGFYLEGHWGCRTESLFLVKEVDTKYEFGGHRYLGWERITQVPIQTFLVDWSLLTKSEISWLNEHNTAVQAALLPLLQGDEDKDARDWVNRMCKPKKVWPWTGA